METNGRDTLNKLVIGGCGTQVGLFLTCSTFTSILMICLVCILSSLLTITLTDLARQLSQAPEVSSAIEAPVGEGMGLASANAAAVSAQTASLLPTATPPTEVIITTLPSTGATTLSASRPPAIVTANQGRVNLRIGPSTNYPRIGLLPNNASLEIVGRNSDSTWWLVSTTEGLAWIYDGVVATSNLHGSIPVVDVNIPPTASQARPNSRSTVATPQASTVSLVAPTPASPVGTPTASANANRLFVQQTVGYKRLREHLAAPPVSENFAPRGDPIVVTEGTKLHLVAGDGSYSKALLDSNEIFRISGGAVWSPDGEYIAFVVDYKEPKCQPCRSVGLVRLADESIFFLKTPDNWDGDAPRWTQDGRLLINVHPSEPADGITYVYDTTGRGQKAEGLYQLSASHEGQKWFPWQPGRTWRAGVSERPDTYYD